MFCGGFSLSDNFPRIQQRRLADDDVPTHQYSHEFPYRFVSCAVFSHSIFMHVIKTVKTNTRASENTDGMERP